MPFLVCMSSGSEYRIFHDEVSILIVLDVVRKDELFALNLSG